MLPYQTQEAFAGMHHNAPMAYGNSGMGGMIPGMNMPRSDTGIPDRSDPFPTAEDDPPPSRELVGARGKSIASSAHFLRRLQQQ